MRFFRDMSFKVKTILGIAFIESILLAIIYFTSINSLNETNENQIRDRANETSSLISLWVRNGLLTYDVGNIEQFIDGLVQADSLVYVHIKNDSGKTFAFSGDSAHLLKVFDEDFSLKDAEKDGVFDVKTPVVVDGMQIGTVEMGLSVDQLSRFIEDVAHRIKVIAITEVILSALFSWMLGWFLTRRLDSLKESALLVQKEGVFPLMNDDANDEIGTVSRAIKEMANDLIEKQASLKTQTVKLEKVFDSTPEGVVVLMNDGTIGSVNPSFERIVTCHRPINNAGMTFDQLISVFDERLDHSDFSSEKWLHELKHYKDSMDVEINKNVIQFANPFYKLIEVRLQRIVDEESGINFILYLQDLTRLQELERMKSTFLAHAAHELRTPLTSVQGFSELLMMRQVGDDDRVELATIINTQAKRVVTMVNDLLDIVKIESEGEQALNIESTDMKEIINQVVSEFIYPEDRIPPFLFLDENLPNVQVDKDRMLQAILNLLSNAYKYSNTGDLVHIYLEDIPNENKKNQEGGLQIRVVDTGIGMTQEQVANVFERFWRADESGQTPGTGLGMSLVKELIVKFGGEIEVKSQFGHGTEVIICLYK